MLRYTPEEISKIFHLKSNGFTWKNITIALDSTASSVRQAHYTANKKAGLPPKVKFSKPAIKGRLALPTKTIVFEDPEIAYGDIPEGNRSYWTGRQIA